MWNRPDVYGPAVRWTLPKSILTAITNPPQFEVRAFNVPDTALDGSTFRLSVDIANTGLVTGCSALNSGMHPSRTTHRSPSLSTLAVQLHTLNSIMLSSGVAIP